MDQKQNVIRYISNQFKAEYKEMGEKIVAKTQAYLNMNVSIEDAVEFVFRDIKASKLLLDNTRKSIVKAALIGLGYSQSKVFAVLANKGLTSKILKASYSGNETTLSKNVHSNVRLMKKIITRDIKQSIQDKESIIQASRKLFDGYGYGSKIDEKTIAGRIDKLSQMRINGELLPDNIQKEIRKFRRYTSKLKTQDLRIGYNQLLDSIEKGSTKQIEKNLWVAVQEKSRYHATMIAKTETAVAYGNAFESRSHLDPDVSAIKYTLSSNHKIYDICNLHTSVDFGFGKGVHPLNHLPKFPFHPNCDCMMSEVFRNKVPVDVKISQDKQQKALQQAIDKSGDNKVKLLGKDGAESFENGRNTKIKGFEGYHKSRAVVSREDFETIS